MQYPASKDMALQRLSLWLFANLPSRTVNKSPPISVFFPLPSAANGAKKIPKIISSSSFYPGLLR